jgi:hypothetical protein
MEKLLELGFEKAATAKLAKDNHGNIKGIEFCKEKYEKAKNILYAMVFGDNADENEEASQVTYIGHTRKTFSNRMNGYQSPGKTQAVNQRINEAIRNHLAIPNKNVVVYVLSDKMTLSMHELHIDVAAGLEYSLIAFYSQHNITIGHPPLLNIAGNQNYRLGQTNVPAQDIQDQIIDQQASEDADYEVARPPAGGANVLLSLAPNCQQLPCRFIVDLSKKTYWDQPVFNVPVACQQHFGVQDDIVRVDLTGIGATSLEVRINRNANIITHAPRLYFVGDAGDIYTQWKTVNHQRGDQVTVDVVSYNHIILT